MKSAIKTVEQLLQEHVDINWAAGFFDGEGTFQIAKDVRSRGGYHARMRVGGCHRGAIERFSSIMGLGNVVRENTPASNSNFKQFRWSTSGQNAVRCAKVLREFLTVKRKECEILLRWEPLIANGRNVFLTDEIIRKREELYHEMLTARVADLVPVAHHEFGE